MMTSSLETKHHKIYLIEELMNATSALYFNFIINLIDSSNVEFLLTNFMRA